MARRRYLWCKDCDGLVIVAGIPQRGDRACTHRFAREVAKPTVYYLNKDGEMWVPPSAEDTCPLPGWQRHEVQPHEIRKFERQMNAKMRDDHYRELQAQAETNERASRDREQVRRQLADELREESKHRSPEEREFLDHVLRESAQESNYSRSEYDSNFHIGAWS